jgi:phospholipid transport system substrate-binding protein
MARSGGNALVRACGSLRCNIAVFGLAIASALLAIPASAATPAEAFVEANIQTGLGILQDKSLSEVDRRAHIRAFLLALLDTHRIGLYALGPAQQTASPADLDAYSQAFQAFMIASYESRLGGYDGQSMKVTGSVEHGPGDYVVSAQIVDPTDPPGTQEPEVDLRVVDEGGKFFVVDASIEGIWLAIAQHDDFGGFLKQHNGDIAALTAHLNEMTAQIVASPGAAH